VKPSPDETHAVVLEGVGVPHRSEIAAAVSSSRVSIVFLVVPPPTHCPYSLRQIQWRKSTSGRTTTTVINADESLGDFE
jgi:hypothetical protein